MKALFLIAACVALFAAYAIGFAAPGFDVYHDDGIYLVTAKALADGSGYKIISLPEPIAQTRYISERSSVQLSPQCGLSYCQSPRRGCFLAAWHLCRRRRLHFS